MRRMISGYSIGAMKPTYVSVLGLAHAKALAEELREEAQAVL